MIRTPYESIELVCLVNQLEAEWPASARARVRDEYRALLAKHDITVDEKHLWT